MKTGKTLVELATEIQRNSELKKDFVANTGAATCLVIDRKPVLELPDGMGTYPLLPLAIRQIASHTDIPLKYVDRMREHAPDLLATNINAWFRLDPKKRMVRTLDGKARAFLSNRYRRVENEKIAKMALTVFAQDVPDIKLVSTDVTDSRLYIQAVSPRLEGQVKVGDLVQCGIKISNSEVGLGAYDVSELDYRLSCLNGAVGTSLLSGRHVGRQVDDNEDLYADDTRAADDDALMLKVRDMIRAAVDPSRFQKRIEKMQGLAGAKIEGKIERAVELLAPLVGASDGEKDGIFKALIEGADLSAWGLLNAVTAQAHVAKDMDRCVELEEAGGRLLNLDPSEWKKVLVAA